MKTKKRTHILLIDDDQFLLHAMKKALELAYYKVTVSSNAYDALFKLNMIKPDVIVLDVILPDLNGVELMHIINAEILGGKIPIILMSFLPKNELQKMGYNLGSAPYLDKPFDLKNLPFIVKNVIFNA